MKHLTLVVLAAGASKRFGGGEKLLAQWKGRQLLAHTLEKFQKSPVQHRIVVVRPGARELAALAGRYGYEVLENPLAHEGIGASIAVAVRQCVNSDGVLIALGDQPLINETTINAIVAAWRGAPVSAIAAPIFHGRRGHPVILARQYFPELSALAGDRGAAGVIDSHKCSFIGVDVEDEGVTIDFDLRADFMGPGQETPDQSSGSDGDNNRRKKNRSTDYR